MTDSGGDPLVSSVASVLRVPLVELYALLWRAGVVEIHRRERAPLRSARPASRAARGPVCPDPSAHDSQRQSRPSPQQRIPALAPSRRDPAEYSQATG
ncbi:Rv1535 domain-containing protein [Mycobacterium sp. E2462]|uniref:Rv1535 domain-containing protein n=1 Tax=Mycobacterium sp. E2462 TaxID=1834133 RepID=UPI00210173CB|nr:Rv1535 domain-containing protein [Mycobacterium sp. E2462]